jgi:hypothetical protein
MLNSRKLTNILLILIVAYLARDYVNYFWWLKVILFFIILLALFILSAYSCLLIYRKFVIDYQVDELDYWGISLIIAVILILFTLIKEYYLIIIELLPIILNFVFR